MDMNCFAFQLKLLYEKKKIEFKEKGGRQKSEAKLTIGSCKREHETDVLSIIPRFTTFLFFFVTRCYNL